MREKIKAISDILRSRYPVVNTQLHHETPFQLLIATILSAQCTDAQVNAVTPGLFRHFPDPASLAAAPEEQLRSLIYSTGFYRNKASRIQACAREIMISHQGSTPLTLEALVSLPGVGRKTANVVLSTILGTPAIVVDTHVSRISRRLGLTDNKDPVSIEFDLMKKLPREDWSDFSLWMIYFGRQTCRAKKPLCGDCPLAGQCDMKPKTRFMSAPG